MQPQISVIVPVYKAERFLRRCIDSILAQTFTDFEIILVNDGSPDNSGAICDEYAQKDSRIKVIHKENGGVSTARNAGLDIAKGKWITFVDADDYIEQGFLNIPLEANEDLLIQNYKVIGSENKVIKYKKKIIQEEYIQDFINTNINKTQLKVPWAKFFNTSIINNNSIKFSSNINIGEDTIFVLEYLYYIKSVQYLDSGDYVYYSIGDVCNKYKLTVNKALYTFKKFIEKYDKLKANSLPFLRFVFIFYWGLIFPKDINSVDIWKNDKIVKKIYNKIHKGINLKWRIKYHFYKIKILYLIFFYERK